ncbi:hypothetical protein PROFUN_17111 [Planoprotostelium fungivorum]|uniref:Uncharacterized protein n=1 Tax=Planoprotostelium fungivorum TaxID=1890364 RepID=A0A2P6MMK7_9EUKA|nr:hypothetical protein PROFUN_17111 [Planoprotostelium fungivorum]
MAQEITLDNFKALFTDVDKVKAALTRANVEAILDDPTQFNMNTVKKAKILGQLQKEGWFPAQTTPAVSTALQALGHTDQWDGDLDSLLSVAPLRYNAL